MTTTMEPIPARRMGHYVHTPAFQRPVLLTLGPDLPGAACKGQGNAWDDTVPGETADQRAARINTAINICHACPTQARCLTERLAAPSLGPGVWGGQLFEHKQGNCAHCGNRIPDQRYSTLRKYCGDTCEKEAAKTRLQTRRAARRPAPVTQHCCICTGAFTPRNKHQLTCGESCQSANNLRRQTERRKTARETAA